VEDVARIGSRNLALVTVAVAVVLVAWASPADSAAGPVTRRVSVSSSNAQGNAFSGQPNISPTGRYVGFSSWASNLVEGDTNGLSDVFVRDRLNGVTTRLSTGRGGQESNESSGTPLLSADGRFVAFSSLASNLVIGDTNDMTDVFVRDRLTGVTTRVSVGPGGQQANESSSGSSISADGRFVAFTSWASNLVTGDTNGTSDAFLHDRSTGVTRRVSIGSRGQQGADSSFGPSVSADGRFVAFTSFAANLVSGDTNANGDILVRDRSTGVTRRVSVGAGGQQADDLSVAAAISGDGYVVAFHSNATNLTPGDTNGSTDVFAHDRRTGVTRRMSVSSGGRQSDSTSATPSVSYDGRFVAFASLGTTLVDGDTNAVADVFVRDRRLGVTRRVSVGSSGQQANRDSGLALAISADGRHVAFDSHASNLVAGDTNGVEDVFVRDDPGQAAMGLEAAGS
jgi:WD40-like Beta Propeller Repeat